MTDRKRTQNLDTEVTLSPERKSMLNSIQQYRIQANYVNRRLSIYNLHQIKVVPEDNKIEQKAYSIFGENATDYANNSAKPLKSMQYFSKVLAVIFAILAIAIAVVAVGFLFYGVSFMPLILKVAVVVLGIGLVFLIVREFLL